MDWIPPLLPFLGRHADGFWRLFKARHAFTHVSVTRFQPVRLHARVAFEDEISKVGAGAA